MNILVIDNYDSFTYNMTQILKEEGACSYDVVKNDKIEIQTVKSYDKILISPGPGLPENVPILSLLIKMYSENKSILGVCLGHQAIVHAFGGVLNQLARVNHGVTKAVTIVDEDDYLFNRVPNKFEVGLYHSWAISKEDLPKCLKTTAISEDGVIMAIRHRELDVRGVQFHPESIMTKVGRKIIQNWVQY
jgi:anthranilate synthase component 2